MEIVINNLTRMEKDYCCVAGIDLQSNEFVRPVLKSDRISTKMLKRYKGIFDIASVVRIDDAQHAPKNPPHVEDYIIDLNKISFIKDMAGNEFWELLEKVSKSTLQEIFGNVLIKKNGSAAVDSGVGTCSLGCLHPSSRPQIKIKKYTEGNKIKVCLHDSNIEYILPVTDIRLYEDDHKTPNQSMIDKVNKKLDEGVDLIVSVGLTRAWRKHGDNDKVHWLQLNNFHFRNEPTWKY